MTTTNQKKAIVLGAGGFIGGHLVKRLKEEVNLVRRERVIFDNVFKKLEMDLKLKEEELKKYLKETI